MEVSHHTNPAPTEQASAMIHKRERNLPHPPCHVTTTSRQQRRLEDGSRARFPEGLVMRAEAI